MYGHADSPGVLQAFVLFGVAAQKMATMGLGQPQGTPIPNSGLLVLPDALLQASLCLT